MKSCPNCQFELSDEAIAQGRCPQCQAEIDLQNDAPATHTLDDLENVTPSPQTNESSEEYAATRGMETVDSVDDILVPQPADDLSATIEHEFVDPESDSDSIDGIDPVTAPGGATIDESLLDSVEDSDSIEVGGAVPAGSATIDESVLDSVADSDSVEVGGGVPAGSATIDESVLDSDADSDSIEVGGVTPVGNETIDESWSDDTGPGIDKTVDSTEFPPVVPSGQTIDDSRIDQTVDSVDFVEGVPSSDTANSDEIRIAQTVDSAEFASVDINKTVDSGDDFSIGDVAGGDDTIMKTVDSTELPGPVGDATVDSAEFAGGTPPIAQTVDSVDGVPPNLQRQGTVVEDGDNEIVKTLDSLWGEGPSEATPQMTVKGVEGKDDRTITGGNLVIQSRAVTTSRKGAQTADYELQRQLGEGGMGVVYSARQASIDRQVAVKMLKARTVKDQVQRDKFLSEAVVTGELDHPNIVPIYDLGTDSDGALFYSMKEVKGTPWMDKIGEKSISENVDILLSVADAVRFAHDKGVIHRDLKPENIMLGAYGEVLVMDWGLAVATDEFRKKGVARAVSMGGTPAYMAPEMAAGPLDRIGIHSDVYLLGAMLYEVVTGKLPHTGKDTMKCLFAAAKNQIQPTKKKGELIDIAMKAMETEPEDRYQSVAEFQAALRLYQEHSESIVLAANAADQLEQAKQTDDYNDYSQAVFGFQEAYNLWDQNVMASNGVVQAKLDYAKSAQRRGDYDLGLSLLDEDSEEHRSLKKDIEAALVTRNQQEQRNRTLKRAVAAIVGVFLIVVSSLLVLVWFQKADIEKKRILAVKATKEAKAQKKEADHQRDIAQNAEKKAVVARDDAITQKKKAEHQKKLADEARNVAVMAKQAAETAKGKEEVARKQAEKNEKIAIKARMDAETAKVAADKAREKEEVARKQEEAARKAADLAKEKEEYEAYVARIGLAAAKIEENAFGQARDVLNECKKELRNWEWGRLMHLCDQSVNELTVGKRIDTIAADAAGQKCISGSRDGQAIVWNVKTGKRIIRLSVPNAVVGAVALAPNGKVAAVGTNNSKRLLQLWNLATNKTTVLQGHSDTITSAQFSRDGKRLLTSSYDKTAIVWNTANGQPIHVLRGHTWWVYSAQFSVDETRVVTASRDGTVLAWNLNNRKNNQVVRPVPFTGHSGPVFTAAFSPDGQWIASAGYDKRILLWKPSELRAFDYDKLLRDQDVPKTPFVELKGHTAAVRKLQFDASGSRILSGSHDNSMKIWFARDTITSAGRVRRGTLAKTLRGHSSLVRDCVLFDGDKRALSASYDGRIKIWDIGSYEEQRMFPGHVLAGHSDAVLFASFSNDGKHIATASRDRTAKKWDVRSGAELKSFREGHSFLVSQGVFFDQGRRLLTAAVDNSVRVWNVATGSEVYMLSGTGRGAAAGISNHAKWIVTGSDIVDRERRLRLIKLWDASNGKLIRTLPGHRGVLTAVSFGANDKWMITGDSNGRVLLWDTSNWSSQRMRWHTSRVNAAAFLPAVKAAVTVGDDKTLCYWDISDPANPKAVQSRNIIHPDAVTSVSVTKDGKQLVTSCEDDMVRCWNLSDTKKPVWQHKWDAAKSDVRHVTISSDDARALAVDSRRHVVHLLGMKDGREIKVPKAGGESGSLLELKGRAVVWSAAFSPDGQRVLTLGGNEARLFDLQGKEHMSFSPHRAVAAASFSPDGQRLVTASWDNTARIWNAATGAPLLKLGRAVAGPQGAHRGGVNSASFSRDGSKVLTASSDGTMKIWDAKTGRVLLTLTGHKGAVRSAIFSPDGSQILSSSTDATARLWNAQTGKQVAQFVGHRLGVTSAQFSPQAKRIITASEDNSAIIWSVATKKPLHTLSGHTATVSSAAFSPDGNRVLTGCDDFTAKLWDANTAKEILTLKGHTQAVTSVSFSVNGRDVLTSSRDGTAILWLTSEWTRPVASE